MKTIVKLFVGMAATFAFTSSAMATELVTNGDFEAGLSGWNTYGHTASVVNIGGAHQNVAYLNDDNSSGHVGIHQDIYIPTSTTSLWVSFDYKFREQDTSRYFTDSLTAILAQKTGEICIFICVPVVDVDSVSFTENSGGWTNFMASVNVNHSLVDEDPNARIKFDLHEISGIFHDRTNSWAKIDNVSILTHGNGGGGANEVPEPASLALLGAGLLGLGIARRRRKV